MELVAGNPVVPGIDHLDFQKICAFPEFIGHIDPERGCPDYSLVDAVEPDPREAHIQDGAQFDTEARGRSPGGVEGKFFLICRRPRVIPDRGIGGEGPVLQAVEDDVARATLSRVEVHIPRAFQNLADCDFRIIRPHVITP